MCIRDRLAGLVWSVSLFQSGFIVPAKLWQYVYIVLAQLCIDILAEPWERQTIKKGKTKKKKKKKTAKVGRDRKILSSARIPFTRTLYVCTFIVRAVTILALLYENYSVFLWIQPVLLSILN